jgi:hypothetical protein
VRRPLRDRTANPDASRVRVSGGLRDRAGPAGREGEHREHDHGDGRDARPAQDRRSVTDDTGEEREGDRPDCLTDADGGGLQALDLLPRLKTRESHHGISGQAWPYGFKTHPFQASFAW